MPHNNTANTPQKTEHEQKWGQDHPDTIYYTTDAPCTDIDKVKSLDELPKCT